MSAMGSGPGWWQEPSIFPEEAWGMEMMGLPAGGRGRWGAPSASESGLPACSPQGAPELKPHPLPASCFGTQHCPPASILFKPETPEERFSELKQGVGNGNLNPAHCDSNVSRLLLALLSLAATRQRWAQRRGSRSALT